MTNRSLESVIDPGYILGSFLVDESDFLAAIAPGLCLDVGAHVGQSALKYMQLGHRCISFEPNPKNLPYLHEKLSVIDDLDSRWEFHQAAVSDTAGEATFTIPNEVGDDSTGWAKDFVGSSATGSFHAAAGSADAYTVATVTLDDTVTERVDYLKVDVQGFEHLVLGGARELLHRGDIGYMKLEFLGNASLLKVVQEAGFYVFDQQTYQTQPTLHNTVWEDRPIDIVQEGLLSTSKPFRKVSIPTRPRRFDHYTEFVSKFVSWTDLWCVHSSRLREFLAIADKLESA